MTTSTPVPERLRTAQALGKLTMTQRGRDLLTRFGHRSGDTIFVGLADETIGHLLYRFMSQRIAEPVLVAVQGKQGIRIVTFSPGTPPTGVTDTSHDEHAIHAESTLGMLLDYMTESRQKELKIVAYWAQPTVRYEEDVLA